jgi:hypothetical protein
MFDHVPGINFAWFQSPPRPISGRLPAINRGCTFQYSVTRNFARNQLKFFTVKELPAAEHPAGISAGLTDHAKLMYDMHVLAYQCELTRIVTFLLAHEFSGRTYPEAGVPDEHHPISHHQGDPEWLAKLSCLFGNQGPKIRLIQRSPSVAAGREHYGCRSGQAPDRVRLRVARRRVIALVARTSAGTRGSDTSVSGVSGRGHRQGAHNLHFIVSFREVCVNTS